MNIKTRTYYLEDSNGNWAYPVVSEDFENLRAYYFIDFINGTDNPNRRRNYLYIEDVVMLPLCNDIINNGFRHHYPIGRDLEMIEYIKYSIIKHRRNSNLNELFNED